MTKTFKILSTISFIVMAIVLTFVGVWALTDLDFTVGGDITYTAPEPEPVTPEEVSYLTFEYYEDLTAKLMSCSSSAPTKVEIPAQIEKDGKTYTVTSINNSGVMADLIGEYYYGIFYDTNVTDVVIPDTITQFCEYSFAECSLNNFSIGTSASVEGVGESEWAVGLSIETLTIRRGVTKIADWVFGDVGIQNLILPEGLQEIGESAFMWTGLENGVTIPDSVEVIGISAFNGCLFSTITIPSKVTEIGDHAFYNCYSLTEVYVKNTTPPTLTMDEFLGAYNTFGDEDSVPTIYVPRASETLYKTADGWIEYADNIVSYDF